MKGMTPEQIAMMRDFYTRMTLNNSGCGFHVIGGTILLIIGLLLTACTTTQYVPVIEQHTDTMWKNRTVHDSIYVHDSTTVKGNGDTLIVHHWHTEFRDRWRTDTMYISHRDSVPKPYPVEKKLSKWEKFCLDYGKVATGGTVVCLFLIIAYLVRRIKKPKK